VTASVSPKSVVAMTMRTASSAVESKPPRMAKRATGGAKLKQKVESSANAQPISVVRADLLVNAVTIGVANPGMRIAAGLFAETDWKHVYGVSAVLPLRAQYGAARRRPFRWRSLHRP
jgi:hypothetical protein